MSEQQELFDNEAIQGAPTPSRVDGSLIFSRSPHRPMTQAQQTFNRCVQRIEDLRRRHDQRRQELDQHLTFCHTQLWPLQQRLIEIRRNRIPILHGCLTRGLTLSKKKTNLLRRLLKEELYEVMNPSGTLPSPELEAIFKDLHGISVQEAANQDLMDMKKDLETLADVFGADIDVDQLKPNLTPEEMARLMAEWDQQIRTQSETNRDQKPPKNKSRPKSARTLEREARKRAAEELRERDLATLYKQLAKMLHPDLEQDPARRLEKETAMKLLTTANREKDLHTMLRLEMDWILREQSDLAHLTDKKLAVYNAVLKEQVKQLEEELHRIHQHPRYQLLWEFGFNGDSFEGNLILQQLQDHLASVEQSTASLQGPRAKESLEKFLRDHHPRRHLEMPLDDIPF